MFQELAQDIQTYVRERMPEWRLARMGVENMTLAVMGCVVNGPGESKHASIGISLPGTGEAPAAPVFAAGGTFAVSATGGASGNAVVFGSTTPGVCTVAGSTVTMVSAGNCTLSANQAGNANYKVLKQAELDHPIEAVGKRLRANMKWLSATAQASTPASQAEQAMA